ncbi:MAG: Holliday junction branch migration protein RuvA [Bacteroidales bacterium]
MYAFISGEFVEVNPAYAIVQCNGVGYQINISLYTFGKIKDLVSGRLFTHLIVREDAHTLYGFSTEDERDIFRHLISVSGIGPNTARVILSSLSVGEVVNAIQREEVMTFQKIKGIGVKSAQRIIIDLKDKVDKAFRHSDISVPKHNTHQQEALSALILLGFNKIQAGKAVEKVADKLGSDATVELLIKECLKIL